MAECTIVQLSVYTDEFEHFHFHLSQDLHDSLFARPLQIFGDLLFQPFYYLIQRQQIWLVDISTPNVHQSVFHTGPLVINMHFGIPRFIQQQSPQPPHHCRVIRLHDTSSVQHFHHLQRHFPTLMRGGNREIEEFLRAHDWPMCLCLVCPLQTVLHFAEIRAEVKVFLLVRSAAERGSLCRLTEPMDAFVERHCRLGVCLLVADFLGAHILADFIVEIHEFVPLARPFEKLHQSLLGIRLAAQQG
mmetsp:Transcript_68133/g.110543  ORF Transcript_68133/g.110543 Transcript_68133/m.110543 type:complete len:245 (-) Transcript_68133:610-1344(-)